MELVHIDYLSLEPFKGNIENALVITDHFTRYALAYPSKTQAAQATSRILWHNFICHYGFPEKFISDQGRNFESDLIKELCKIAVVKKLYTTPYHPLGNGQCERFNSTLCNMLGTLSDEEKSDWKSYLGCMTHAYNCTKHASTIIHHTTLCLVDTLGCQLMWNLVYQNQIVGIILANLDTFRN